MEINEAYPNLKHLLAKREKDQYDPELQREALVLIGIRVIDKQGHQIKFDAKVSRLLIEDAVCLQAYANDAACHFLSEAKWPTPKRPGPEALLAKNDYDYYNHLGPQWETTVTVDDLQEVGITVYA